MNSLLSLLFPQIPVSNFTSLFLVCLVPFCLSNKDLRVLHAAEQSQSPATGYKAKKETSVLPSWMRCSDYLAVAEGV